AGRLGRFDGDAGRGRGGVGVHAQGQGRRGLGGGLGGQYGAGAGQVAHDAPALGADVQLQRAVLVEVGGGGGKAQRVALAQAHGLVA
nr:hypothetical protein [Tanacetum cinerariifolium]